MKFAQVNRIYCWFCRCAWTGGHTEEAVAAGCWSSHWWDELAHQSMARSSSGAAPSALEPCLVSVLAGALTCLGSWMLAQPSPRCSPSNLAGVPSGGYASGPLGLSHIQLDIFSC